MRRILKAIETRTAEFRQRPLFAFLRDSSIPPAARLAFAPDLAHYVLTFGDLCRYVFPEMPARDRFQVIVNAHTREEVDHWQWYLADLETLGHDAPLRYSDALRRVFGTSSAKSRVLSYQLCRLALGADSLQRLVLLHVVEATGDVAVKHVGLAGRAFAAQTGRTLTYFGGGHADAEDEHAMWDEPTRRLLEDHTLDPATEAALRALVEEAFRHYEAFIDEMYTLARAASGEPAGSATNPDA